MLPEVRAGRWCWPLVAGGCTKGGREKIKFLTLCGGRECVLSIEGLAARREAVATILRLQSR